MVFEVCGVSMVGFQDGPDHFCTPESTRGIVLHCERPRRFTTPAACGGNLACGPSTRAKPLLGPQWLHPWHRSDALAGAADVIGTSVGWTVGGRSTCRLSDRLRIYEG